MEKQKPLKIKGATFGYAVTFGNKLALNSIQASKECKLELLPEGLMITYMQEKTLVPIFNIAFIKVE